MTPNEKQLSPSHSMRWSSDNPGLLILMLDQSGSMNKLYRGDESRIQFATRAINEVINDIIDRNFNGYSPKNRCHIVVIGYASEAKVLCEGSLSELHNAPLRRDTVIKRRYDGKEIRKQVPIWINTVTPHGCTDMVAAFRLAKEKIERWINEHPNSPAPVILNISDGMPYFRREEMEECAAMTKGAVRQIMNIRTLDGEVLVFNAEVGNSSREIVFPASLGEVQEGGFGAKFLFDISSAIPAIYESDGFSNGLEIGAGARGAVFSAKPETLTSFIRFGTSRV